MRGMRFSTVALLALPAVAQTPQEGLDFFESRVRPVLVKNCYPCHSREAKTAQGGFVLDSRDGIRRGGQSGAGIVPGKPDESRVIQAIRYDGRLKMPVGQKLPDAAIADLTRWVEMGAPDPRESKAAPVYPQVDLAKGRQFWAFQAPRRSAPPAVRQAAWVRGTIDRHILAELEKKGLAPVADADRRTLLRRLTYDLTGLPPTPEEIESFVKDRSRNAVAAVVDRLLASPRFGERWGRHWLDVARYADSMGRTRNVAFGSAWRYRDWVIGAFNEDKPYDRFLREQLAGDLLPAASAEERDRNRIATGFLAIGAHDLNEADRKQSIMDVTDEMINVTTRAMLGLTVGCARCHDHKFDPIPTKDYYALAGIFRSTDLRNGMRTRPQFNQVLFNPARLVALEGGGTAEDPAVSAKRAELWAKIVEAEKGRDRLKVVGLGREWAQIPAPPNMAMGVAEAEEKIDCEVNLRGDPHSLGDKVPRGFIQVVYPADAPLPRIGSGESGRLQLAEWLTRPDNPLTARVAVNRIWHHLFGRGIVDTVDNLGNSGSRPTNQALLDYLAVRFAEQGWSVKKLIREVVLSHTYQLSTQHNAKNFEADPDNKLHWRMNRRRLEVEAIRDSMLAVSGKIDFTAPGAGPMAQIGGNQQMTRRRKDLTEDWERTLNVRTVYLPVIRNAVARFLETFDFPEPSETHGKRDVTTVPTQALFLMNDPLVRTHAKAAAERLTAQEKDDAARTVAAYRQVLGRDPDAVEKDRALTYVRNARETGDDIAGDQTVESWARFYQALFASAEFRYRN